MSVWNERRDAHETRFAREEEARFKATARRNRLFGLWVAGRLGWSGTEADAYAEALVLTGLDGDEAVVKTAAADLARAGIDLAEPRLRSALEGFAVDARPEPDGSA
jgi:hypothetical protein